jgi:hypothetical protein
MRIANATMTINRNDRSESMYQILGFNRVGTVVLFKSSNLTEASRQYQLVKQCLNGVNIVAIELVETRRIFIYPNPPDES